jgi:type VI protein secretion system component VasK
MYLYIIAIGWTYVVLMMAVTAKSFVAGALTFIFYGLLPLGIVFYITLKQLRRSRMVAQERLNQPDRADAQPDQDRLL